MKNFCILPWTHLQLDHDGSMIPCCRSAEGVSYGSARTQTVSEIWNGDAIRKMRLDLLEGEQPAACEDCFRRESWGEPSLRLESNELFREFFDSVGETGADGSVSSEGPVYLSLRLSNICNFSCRMCAPRNSSAFSREEALTLGTKEESSVTRAFQSSQELEERLGSLVPSLQKVYFAGGEPLLDDQHYIFLEKMLAAGRTDIELLYSSNLSTLSHRSWDATELWSRFKRVKILASLDGIDGQAELLRKGTRWPEVERNFRTLREAAPHVQFVVYPTVSAMNAFHLPRALRRWIELGMIRKPDDLYVSTLTGSPYFSFRVLNEGERAAVAESYRSFIENDLNDLSPELRAHIVRELGKVTAAFLEPFEPGLRRLFRRATFTFDRIRNERLVSLFPELIDLLYEA